MSHVTSGKPMDFFTDISVVLVVWQNEQYLRQCLDALQAQSLQPMKVVVVFNGDQVSEDYFDGYDLKFEFIEFDENVGFAKANNAGVAFCNTEWVALLNVDAFPERGWLEHLQKATKDYTEFSTFASKQIQYNNPELLDGIGDAYHISGLIWREAYGQKLRDQPNDSKEIFSACAAAVLYNKAAFDVVGGFDEDYFAYSEDIDLGFRLQLQGYRCLFVPEATVEHVGSASTGGQHSDFAMYHGHRNLVWTFFKNMPLGLLLICLPFHLLLNAASIIYFSVKGRANTILRAKKDAFVKLKPIWKKRKHSLTNRKISIVQLWSLLHKGLK